MSTAASGTETLVERMSLKTLVESCLVLEEGVASAKDIEVGMMMGAGILPGPFTRADEAGPRRAAGRARARARRVGRQLRAAGDPARASSPRAGWARSPARASSPIPQPDAGDQRETVLLETRGDVGIAWLNRPPANPLSPQAIRDLIDLWEQVDGKLRALVFASSNIFTFCAGADIKAFTKMSPDTEGRELVESAHRFMRGMEQSQGRHDRGGQLDRVRRRLRAGDGLRLPHRGRVGDVRPAGDQPRASSPASAARSGCRGWSARPRRWR